MNSERATDTIGSRLERIARRLPGKIALTDGETEVSFRALDDAATVIARRVAAATAGRNGPVCLLFANKVPAVHAIFGAGRSGHTYVPLDAADPEDRLRLIVRDSEPIALLTEGSMLERARTLAPPGCAVIDIGHLGEADDIGALPDVSADALVYLFYTSGSTGQPKGVGQTHRNLLFFVDAYARTLRIVEDDRVSLLYSMSFSAANMDIFGALLNGATLCTYELRRSGIRHLAGWLDRERISVLHAVPTIFRELAASLPAGRRLPHLRAIDLGGEAVFGRDVELFREHTPEHCILVNHLAATEASVVAQHVIGHSGAYAADAMIPVGRCTEGLRVEIRRDDGSPASRNETGEMIIASPHVSPGYWRRPELNAEAFAADPERPGWRRYFSGDFGYIDDGGNLNFLGRRGSRIKLRGQSVELNEVEAALAACPGVTKVAVLPVGERSAEPDRLVAYVATATEEDRDPLRMRRHAATRIPAYMCPTGFVFLDALPLTASGKVDRKALQSMPPPESDTACEFEPPRDDIETKVAEIFQQLLNRAPVGRNDDFFLQGGDSLAAFELQSRLRRAFGASPSNFHEDATVAGIAAGVRSVREMPATGPRVLPVLTPLWRQGSAPPLFLVHGRHGQAFVSPHFMRLLGNDQPVWAFQARGLDGLHEPHATIEAMAADYLGELRRVHPHGPYFLGALCAGALVAAEMARLLRESGETLLPLLLLDPRGQPRQGDYQRLSEEPFANKMRARAAMGRIAGPVDDPVYMQALVRTVTAFERAIASHRPRPYDGPAYMLGSRQRLGGPNSTYLKSVFTGKVERFEVATSHAQVLDPANADFAARLARCLSLIRGDAIEASTDQGTESPAVRAATLSPLQPRRPAGVRSQPRNGPCPCGSGRRFKHCHGQLASEGPADGADKVDFVIAGAQRSGTTVLDLYVREHPRAAMPWTRKELHFFDDDEHFRDRVDYGAYHANFARRTSGQLRGEATPSYMYWRPAAARMARYNPALKIIIVLRNPITRAYSHWNKERQRGREPLPFLEALMAEPGRIRASAQPQVLRSSYVDRGFYARQLQHLWQFFPAGQILVLRSTDLEADPEATLGRVAKFLGLEPFPRAVPKTANVRQYENSMQPKAWDYLADIYAEEIRELERLLGWDCTQWRTIPQAR